MRSVGIHIPFWSHAVLQLNEGMRWEENRNWTKRNKIPPNHSKRSVDKFSHISSIAQPYQVAFTLRRFRGKRTRTYCLFVKKLLFTLFVYINLMKTGDKNNKFWIWYKSVHLKNGTTSHLSFSSCEQQKRLKTSKIRYWQMTFTLSCIKPHPMITKLPVLLFRVYSFNLFLAQTNESV